LISTIESFSLHVIIIIMMMMMIMIKGDRRFDSGSSGTSLKNKLYQVQHRQDPAMDQHPIQGGVEKLLFTSCYGNQLWPDWALGLYTDFTFTLYSQLLQIWENDFLASILLSERVLPVRVMFCSCPLPHSPPPNLLTCALMAHVTHKG